MARVIAAVLVFSSSPGRRGRPPRTAAGGSSFGRGWARARRSFATTSRHAGSRSGGTSRTRAPSPSTRLTPARCAPARPRRPPRHGRGARPRAATRSRRRTTPTSRRRSSYLSTIRLPQAWDVSHGSLGVVVAVVDTGVSLGRRPVDADPPGRNFVAGNADAHDDSVIGHGTLVAGIAAATTNNGIGIAGAAWNASVLPVKVLDSRGFGTDSQVAAGVVWAADHGADVINLSLGGPTSGEVLCDAIAYAQSQDALVVASAGNGANGRLNYPAACPGVVAVSATDANGDFASFSSFGPMSGSRRRASASCRRGTTTTTARRAARRSRRRWSRASRRSWSRNIRSGAPRRSRSASRRRRRTAVREGRRVLRPRPARRVCGARRAGAAAGLPEARRARAQRRRDRATTLQKKTTATIAPEGDVDWYAVSLRVPARVRIDVAARPYDAHTGPNLRPVAQLYDADLDQLAHAEPDSQLARLAFRLPAGLYYVRVTNGCGARSAGTYSVTLATRLTRDFVPRLMP